MNKINNKGFSLVELLIAITIASIAGIAVFGFISFGSNSYRTTSNDVGLQYEQQVVVNQLRDYILESSNAINFDVTENALYTFAQKEVIDAGTPKQGIEVTKLKFTGSPVAAPSEDEDEDDDDEEATPEVVDTTGDIMVSSKWFEIDPSTSSIPADYKTTVNAVTPGKLASEVKSVVYDLHNVEKNKVTFTVTFLSNGKEISSTQVVSLRNNIKNTSEYDEIVSTGDSTITDYIDSVEIWRDGSKVNGVSSIAKYGDEEVVAVQFAAKVIAKSEYSSRVYGVRWELQNVPEEYIGKINIDSSGRVSVGPEVIEGTTFTISAICVDNEGIHNEVVVTVDNNGYYPYAAVIKSGYDAEGVVEVGNGYIVYNLIPAITYKNSHNVTYVHEGSAAINDGIKWEVTGDKLPGAKNGVEPGLDDNGRLTLTSACSGKTIKVKFTVNRRKVDGEQLVSPEITIHVPTIDPYTPESKFTLVAPSSVLRGTYFDARVEWDDVTEIENISYFWKVEEYRDNTSGEWEATENRVKTDFDATIKPREVDNSEDGIWTAKVSGDVTDFGAFDAGYSAGGWYRSVGTKTFTTDVESFLNWDNMYKFKLMVFATATDDSGHVVLFDLNGAQVLGTSADVKPVKPVETIIRVPKVALKIVPSSYSSSNSYKYIYNGVTEAKYKVFRTDNELHPRVSGLLSSNDYIAPGERRVFNYEVDGLYIYNDGIADLIDSADGRTFNTVYTYYDNNNRVNINVDNKLSPYTVKAGMYNKSSKVDREVYLPSGSQFLFELDVKKKDANGNSTEFETKHPNKMTFYINLNQKKSVKFNGSSVEIINATTSDLIDYHIRYDKRQ